MTRVAVMEWENAVGGGGVDGTSGGALHHGEFVFALISPEEPQ